MPLILLIPSAWSHDRPVRVRPNPFVIFLNLLESIDLIVVLSIDIAFWTGSNGRTSILDDALSTKFFGVPVTL